MVASASLALIRWRQTTGNFPPAQQFIAPMHRVPLGTGLNRVGEARDWRAQARTSLRWFWWKDGRRGSADPAGAALRAFLSSGEDRTETGFGQKAGHFLASSRPVGWMFRMGRRVWPIFTRARPNTG